MNSQWYYHIVFTIFIFNSCIEKGVVPHEWKSAIVSPLFKNKGVNSDMNNYRASLSYRHCPKYSRSYLMNRCLP